MNMMPYLFVARTHAPQILTRACDNSATILSLAARHILMIFNYLFSICSIDTTFCILDNYSRRKFLQLFFYDIFLRNAYFTSYRSSKYTTVN